MANTFPPNSSFFISFTNSPLSARKHWIRPFSRSATQSSRLSGRKTRLWGIWKGVRLLLSDAPSGTRKQPLKRSNLDGWAESRSGPETANKEVVEEFRSPTCPPLIQVFALSGELEDPGVAVAIRHKDAARLGVHRHVGGFAEVITVASWNESLPESQQDSVSAVAADLEHLRRKPDQRFSIPLAAASN